MPKPAGTQHRLGPQRNPEIDTAVLRATRELLVEHGYSAMSIDAIAKRAGVGRPAIYRRWPSKAHIVHEAVYPATEIDWESSGSAAAEIGRLTAGALELFGDAATREAVPGLIGEVRADPALREVLVTGQITAVRDELARVLAESTDAVRPAVNVDAVLDLIAGSAVFARCVRDADDDTRMASSIADILLHGILR